MQELCRFLYFFFHLLEGIRWGRLWNVVEYDATIVNKVATSTDVKEVSLAIPWMVSDFTDNVVALASLRVNVLKDIGHITLVYEEFNKSSIYVVVLFVYFCFLQKPQFYNLIQIFTCSLAQKHHISLHILYFGIWVIEEIVE